MKKSEAKSLEEFNSLEARGWVILTTSKIENCIDEIIIDFLDFRNCKSKFFYNFLLNGENMVFGSKIKILEQILKYKKKDNEKIFKDLIENLRKMNRIRNIFAHCYSEDIPAFDVDSDDVLVDLGQKEIMFRVSKNTKGDVEDNFFEKYLKEFDNYYSDDFKESLKELKKLVEN